MIRRWRLRYEMWRLKRLDIMSDEAGKRLRRAKRLAFGRRGGKPCHSAKTRHEMKGVA